MKQKHTIRIIAGDYRTRLLEVIDREGLRPTGNRMRETLFNWLQPLLIGGHCLDLFAGSGALGVESLSRGARTVTFVEKDREAFQVLKKNVEGICSDKARFQLVQGDALQFLNKTNDSFSMIFLDPPFGHADLLSEAVAAINTRPVFESVRYIVMERAINGPMPVIEGFKVHREMKTKESTLSLWMRV